MSVGFLMENRISVAMATLVCLVALLGILAITPMVSQVGPIQLTSTEVQLIEGAGRGEGILWTVFGIGVVVVGVAVLAPALPAIFAGTATITVTVTAIGALSTIGGGLLSVSHGASKLGR